MKKILIVGMGDNGQFVLQWLIKMNQVEIVGVIAENIDSPGIKIAESLNIPIYSQWQQWMKNQIDMIIETTGDLFLQQGIVDNKSLDTPLIDIEEVPPIAQILDSQKMQKSASFQEFILENMEEGIIVIDNNEKVTYMNAWIEKNLGIDKKCKEEAATVELISNIQLAGVLRTRKVTKNKKFTYGVNNLLLADNFPIIDTNGRLIGAFAVIREISEVIELAKQVSGLKEVEQILETIFHSSNEAISVVDEEGKGIMINPAYTRITGLTERDIVGNPATTDISGGESIHMTVLRTRKAIRGARMRVGKTNKEVIVNAAPVIVEGKLKGSVGVLHDVTDLTALSNELTRTKQIVRNLEANYSFEDIVENSSQMQLAVDQAKAGARSSSVILLKGEHGTDKEIFAQAIHNESQRKNYKFIRVNCAGGEKQELELELFGSTDKKKIEKKGVFEQADKGSVFLDEIGELPLSIQSRLIRLLETNKITPVGSSIAVSVDVRIITSTSAKLEKEVIRNSFKEELYEQLNKLTIYIPSLRERTEDLEELTKKIMHKINRGYGTSIANIDRQALSYLRKYDWPGNIRELENVLGRAVISMENREKEIKLKHLPHLQNTCPSESKTSAPFYTGIEETNLQLAVENFEKQLVQRVLQKNEWNKTQSADELGISIRNLYYKMKKYQLDQRL